MPLLLKRCLAVDDEMPQSTEDDVLSPRSPTPGSVARGSPRASSSSKRGAFFNQPPEDAFCVGDLVETLCDSADDDGASSWLPARVTRLLGDSLEVGFRSCWYESMSSCLACIISLG